ncbi:hypothetical protein G5C33_10785 [Sphingosinithalassobacter tenebrarum]|uniref:Exo-alpha-sialidase n=2 Tax=Stakelama tenebrarum TaxID=2711215 RepID=A0A6G6YAN1_9SPHN|nr:hypothetical protein G5C33_10785 [Sphingosinithalassobacter tenebrarum]
MCLGFLANVGANAWLCEARAQEAPAYRWQNVTVGGGGFAPGIVFSPAEAGLAYLRTDMGGAYRWDSARSRWIPLQDGETESSYMGIESIAPDPVDPDIVYLAAGMGSWGPAAIFRSGDRGAHWRKTPVPFPMGGNEGGRGLGERLAVDPHHNHRLFFGSRHDGLWRSTDSGAHWRTVDSFPLPGLDTPESPRQTHGGLSFVIFDPAHAGRVYVGSADPGARHLFRSDDGGESWRAVAGGPEATLLPVKAAVGSDGVLTITYSDDIGPNGITRGAVWRHDPASGAWRDITPEAGPDAPVGGYMGVAVSAEDPEAIAVSTIGRFQPGDTVWRSHDAGESWIELRKISERDVSATPFLFFDHERVAFGHWISGLAIDPFDSEHAAYVTGATLYATQQFGTRRDMVWKPWTRGIEQTAIITFVSPTGGAHLVSGFGDLGGFRHDDLTVSPPHVHRNPMLTNTNSLDYAGLAPQVMVRSGNTHQPTVPDSSLAWSNDGGESWTPLYTPDLASMSPDAPERTGNAAITVSADGSTFLVETRDPLVTEDRGESWAPVLGLPFGSRVTADKVDPQRFYAIDFEANKLLRSDDSGAHFRPAGSTGLPDDLSGARTHGREAANPLVAVPGSAGHLWLLIGDTLYRSADYGESWERAGNGIAIKRYGLGKAAENSDWPAIYAIATLSGVTGIYRSINGGSSWGRINDDAHQWGLRFRVITGDPRIFGRVYLGTDGRGIFYGDPAEREE